MSEIPEVFLPAPKEIRGVDPSCDLSSVSGSNRTADFPRLNRVLSELGLTGRLQEIEIANPPTNFPALEDSYRYEVHLGGGGFRLSADTEWGAITACHTLRQLDLDKSALSNVVIRDQPTYPWRGLMIDVARHYINLKELYLTLDLMAHFHLNVLHLHLSDDQGFRFESKRFTKLQTAPFYTQEQLFDLVEYAADRAIRAVPELDVPGHVTSWLTSYPSWGGKSQVEPSTGFGVHHACLDPSNPDLMPNLLDLFAELWEVFRDQYVHIGGDEVSGQWWNESTAIRDLMDRNGWTEIREVQAWFTQNLVNGIERSGKKVIGWDEVLDPTLSSSVTVQAW
ncbi:MAG: family 20 glycosylhydrolase, partial [Gammaproteobacteria bacterium]|nr:family 20 glycosylhydrolase [Gammaproteobacteria bacterium]